MALPRITLISFRVALVVALIITMYLATTQQEFPVIDDTNDKVKHILAFYVLAFLTDYSAPKVSFTLSKGLTILGYGLLIEVIQYFLPYREFSLFDLAADGIGIVAYAFSQPLLSRAYLLRRRY
jgi:VanZ family protein